MTLVGVRRVFFLHKLKDCSPELSKCLLLLSANIVWFICSAETEHDMK